jgi:hypothetical protein
MTHTGSRIASFLFDNSLLLLAGTIAQTKMGALLSFAAALLALVASRMVRVRTAERT